MTTMPREVTLADLPDEVAAEPVVFDDNRLELEALANQAAEAFIPKNTIRSAVYPMGGYGPLVVGERLIATHPYSRKVTVLLVGFKSAVVECSVWNNDTAQVPHETNPKLLSMRDNWFRQVWRENWAVRTFVHVDPKDSRKTWTEDHCVVVGDKRSERNRITSSSVYDPKLPDGGNPAPVYVVRDPKPDEDENPNVTETISEVAIIRDMTGLSKLHAARALAERRRVDISDISGQGKADAILDRLEGKDNASQERSAAATPEREVRTQMGEEASHG